MSTMKHSDIDNILSQLGGTIKDLQTRTQDAAGSRLSDKQISQIAGTIQLTGDQISGGKIQNFSSVGINDSATNTMLTITDAGIKAHNADINNIKGNVAVEETLTAGNVIVANDLTVSGVLRANVDIDYSKFFKRIPDRGISGDKISGGMIRNFTSTGIKDVSSTGIKIMVSDDAVNIDTLAVSNIQGDITVAGTVESKHVETDTLHARQIHVEELRADIRFERTESLEFIKSAGNEVIGKGVVWKGEGPTRQLILQPNNQIFSTENLNLHRERNYQIDNIPVISFDSLGATVVKSKLREVGNLKSLTVLGDVNLNNHFYYNSTSQRIGIGTEEPNADLSMAKNGIEFNIEMEQSSTRIGNTGYHDVKISTDGVDRLIVGANGSISLGSKNSNPTQVTVHGKLSVGVNNPDQNVDLHVNGSIKFNNKLQTHGSDAPVSGSYSKGDIVWNEEPRTGSPVGWVCVVSGTPGTWRPFGIIG